MTKLWKLTPLVALVTALLLLLAAAFLIVNYERSYREQKIREVSAEAQVLASTVTAAVSFDDHKAAREYVDALGVNPEVLAVSVRDAGGAVLAAFSRGSVRPIDAASVPTPYFAGDRLVVSAPVTQGGTVLGTVFIQAVTEPFAKRVELYGTVALLVIMASLVVGVLGIAHRTLSGANAELKLRAAELAEANDRLRAQIARRREAEEALRQAQKMEAIGQLTGGVAHDFNNLLQVIMGNLETVARAVARRTEGALQRDLGRWTDAAIRGADRAATLTQRLLAFSRRQPLNPQPVDANKLVTGMSDMLRRTLGEGIVTETVLAGGLWRASADANQLENALLNLAVNARDAMPKGGKLTIETANVYLDEGYAAAHEQVAAGQYVMIAVSDTGTGMDKATAAKAFEPFFTTKEVGKGSGLGLSQVYGFGKQSGGHVKIYSELGEGTTVKLYLPRLAAGDAAAEPASGERRAAAPPRAATILLVEDDEDVRAHTGEALRDLGYDVIEAADGEGALRLLESEPSVRLLFTDVGLPGGLNGRQVADEARRRRPRLKVLFTTGYARNAIVHQGRLDPGVALIGKPFTHAALAAKVREVLDQPDEELSP